jgi:hypothetical protein
MTTTAGHSFYIGPIGSFYNQVNDTGSWEPLVIIIKLILILKIVHSENFVTIWLIEMDTVSLYLNKKIDQFVMCQIEIC